MSERVRAAIMLLATMLIWGSTFVVTKYAIRALPPLQLAFVRVLLGALVLGPFGWLRLRSSRTTSTPWHAIVWLGAIGVAFYYVAFNYALIFTSAAQGALVQSCIPAVTALVAVIWLRERASMWSWIGIGLAVLGVVVVFAGGSNEATGGSAFGNLLMFGTVLAWAVYTALAKRVAQCDTLVVTAALLAVGAVLLFPFALWEHVHSGRIVSSTGSWIAIAYLGCGASGIAYLLYNLALRSMDANQAGTYTNLIPIVGVISGVFFGDSLTALHLVGAALVGLGVVLTSSNQRPRRN
jgi:drug/metabolite transporter (DMT)-like permease